MPIINLTNLTIRIADENGEVYKTLEPSGKSVRIHSKGDDRVVDDVPINESFVTAVDGVPEQQEGTFYIVPQPVAYVLNRSDLVLPDTGPTAIRDDNGEVYAVRRLYSVMIQG